MKFTFPKKNQHGYAILFTVVIMGIILSIAIGLSNSTFKQIVLSSVARDSQLAFYEADTATECALYASAVSNALTSGSPWFYCTLDSSGNQLRLSVTTQTQYGRSHGQQVITGYNVTAMPQADNFPKSAPCFDITLNQDLTQATPASQMVVNGYNFCDGTNSRTLQRQVNITLH